MLVIGLTGGIASGKSTVSAILRELGVPVIDADRVAREVVEPGEPAWQEIIDYFGPGVRRPDGTLDRPALGRLVFGQPERLAALNRITHPRVIARMQELQQDIAESPAGAPDLVVWDVPLLIEAGMTGMVDQVWVVVVDPEVQLRRLMERDQMSEAAARQRIASQMALSAKAALADRVIDNNGSAAATRRQVERLVAELRCPGA